MSNFRLYTGPCTVKAVAERLRALGYDVTLEGTQHVYFTSHSYGLTLDDQYAQLKSDGVTGYRFTDLQLTRN
jgi:hypothetical protein